MFTQTSGIIQHIFVVIVQWDLMRYVNIQILMKSYWIMVETLVTYQFWTLVWPKKFLRVLARFLGLLARFLGLLARSCAANFGKFLGFSESCARKSTNVTISPSLVIWDIHVNQNMFTSHPHYIFWGLSRSILTILLLELSHVSLFPIHPGSKVVAMLVPNTAWTAGGLSFHEFGMEA